MSTGPTSIPIDDLRRLRVAIVMAIGSPVLRATYEGRSVEYRTIDDARKALELIDDEILKAGNQVSSRVGLAQHKRGDGPTGPGPFYWENW